MKGCWVKVRQDPATGCRMQMTRTHLEILRASEHGGRLSRGPVPLRLGESRDSKTTRTARSRTLMHMSLRSSLARQLLQRPTSSMCQGRASTKAESSHRCSNCTKGDCRTRSTTAGPAHQSHQTHPTGHRDHHRPLRLQAHQSRDLGAACLASGHTIPLLLSRHYPDSLARRPVSPGRAPATLPKPSRKKPSTRRTVRSQSRSNPRNTADWKTRSGSECTSPR